MIEVFFFTFCENFVNLAVKGDGDTQMIERLGD